MGMMSPPLVLVVDDDDATLEVTRVILEEEGYSVETARNGRAALGLLGNGCAPALLLIDLMMPQVDGYGVIAELERAPRSPILPVVVMTASGPNERSSSLPYPVLRKPFTVEELLHVIARYAPRSWVDEDPTSERPAPPSAALEDTVKHECVGCGAKATTRCPGCGEALCAACLGGGAAKCASCVGATTA